MGRVPAELSLAAVPDGHLAVSEVFGPTVQGEGPSAGQRAAFVRLAHCNLVCGWCDSAYTWSWERHDPAAEIHMRSVDDVFGTLDESLGTAGGRVVVTGGEPLLQQRHLVPLLERCGDRGWPVEIETNGTVAPTADVAALVSQFNVSPKLANSGMPPERRLKPAALAALTATGKAIFKFVVADPGELDEVAEIVATHELEPIWVMPEGTEQDVVLERLRTLADPVVARGWHLTPRLHILLWGDERGR